MQAFAVYNEVISWYDNESSRKYTGIAEEDYATHTDVTANLLYPQFKELHTEVRIWKIDYEDCDSQLAPE